MKLKDVIIVCSIIFIVAVGVGIPVVFESNANLISQVKLEDCIENTISGVVHITNNTGRWQGSGVAIKPDLIVTARHVVETGEDFTITDNKGNVYQATQALSSKDYDVGFIKLNAPVLTPVEFGSIKDCRLGQQVYVIGSPFGKINFNSVTLGIISGLDRDWDFTNYYTGEKYGWKVAFTTDSAGHPGNSGCPVFTMDGKVRGILVGGFSPVLICVMPSDLFLSDVEEIERMFTQNKYEFEESVDIYNKMYRTFSEWKDKYF